MTRGISTLGDAMAGGARIARVAAAAAGTILLLLWTFRPTQDLLRETGVFDDTTIVGVVGVIVGLTLSALIEHDRRLRTVGDRLETFSPDGATQVIQGGVQNVYRHLDAACLQSDSAKRKTLDVLGLTLYTAWPHLRGWVDSEQARDWKVRFYCLAPAFVDEHPEWFPTQWASDARTQIGAIGDFKAENKGELNDRRIALSVREYAFFPAVHGFRVGGETLFISFTHWTKPKDDQPARLNYPHQAYAFFPSRDESALASAHRRLFENWIERAES